MVTTLLADEVTDALAAGRPVVALESTLLAHGLPAPDNRRVATELESLIRDHGAVPATIAVLDGVVRVGLDGSGLDRVCAGDLAKLSVRDLGPAAASRTDGATTVASTAAIAAAAGIAAFATGGLGGVHRGAAETWDVSADLDVLGHTPVLVVASGCKSILDVAATLERLETRSIPVVGYGTDRFPGFYLADSGHEVPWRVDTPTEAAAAFAAHRELGQGAGMLLANPVPAAAELDRDLHDRVLGEGLALLDERNVSGKDVTPVLLEHFHTATGGASLETNIALVRANAQLAAAVAVALARM